MREYVIGLDLDDVTADLNKYAIDWHNEENPNKLLTENDLNDWGTNWTLLSSYYTRNGIYEKLEVIEGAKEVISRLVERYHVIFITGSPNKLATLEKHNWVEEHFPNVGVNNVIATRHKYLINADVLFDDSPEFLPKFPNLKVLMDRLYNQHLEEGYDYDKRVTNWYEFENTIYEFEDSGLLIPKK